MGFGIVGINSVGFDGGELEVGQVVYVVREIRRGEESYTVRPDCPRTNMSHEPIARGWLGETNNISRYAEGRARVTATGSRDNGDTWVRYARIADKPAKAPAKKDRQPA